VCGGQSSAIPTKGDPSELGSFRENARPRRRAPGVIARTEPGQPELRHDFLEYTTIASRHHAPSVGANFVRIARKTARSGCPDFPSGATSYDVYLGPGTPTLATTVTGTTYAVPSPLAGNTAYSWYVIAKNAGGSAPASSAWTFRTDMPDFTMTGGSPPAPWLAGTSGNYGFTLKASNAFSGPINLAAAQLPAGATVSFSPSSVTLTPGQSVNVSATIATLPTDANGAAGSFNPMITATASSAAHTLTVPILLQDFGLNFSKQQQQIPCAGGPLTIELSSPGVNGYDSLGVSLTFMGFANAPYPNGTYGFALGATSVSQQGNTMVVNVNVTQQYCGTERIVYAQLRGYSGGVVHYAWAEVDINAPGNSDFTVAVNPPSQTLAQPGAIAFPVTTNAAGGFGGNVTVNVSGLPAGATAYFTQNGQNVGSQAAFYLVGGSPGYLTLFVTTTPGTPAGTYPLTIIASGANVTHTATVSLNIGTNALPDPGQMALWSAFVDRHELLVGPNGPAGSAANGGLYGLADSDVGTVNSLVDATNAQLIQLQNQAQSLDTTTYLGQRSGILQNLANQLHSQAWVSQQTSQTIDQYVDGFLGPRVSSTASPSTSNTPTTGSSKCPANTNCMWIQSEINFFNGGGTTYGLGAYTKSWVEGPESAYFTSSVTGAKEWWSPQMIPPPPHDPSWQSVPLSAADVECCGKGAEEPHTEKNPRRGSYMIESFHGFVLSHGTHVGQWPPFTGIPYYPVASPEVFDLSSGYDYYQTSVDLQLQVNGQVYSTGSTATVLSCPIVVQAILTPALPPSNQPPPIAWTGGSMIDNLRRNIPCQSGQTVVNAAVGTNLQATITLNVQSQFTITGRVTTPDGAGLAGITVDPGKSIYTDSNGYYSIAVAAGSSYTVTPNDLSGNYWFSPQTSPFAAISSNQIANFTASPVTWVYLIHGIGQTSANLSDLLANLSDVFVGVDPIRYHVDGGFTFGCATSCGGLCSVPPGSTLVDLGGQWLSSYIQQTKPPGSIILVGYSMGGLIARDLIANNYNGVLVGHPVTSLITLGTPNLGYPYSSIDQLKMCSQLLLDMSGSWQEGPSNWSEVTSPYLDRLRTQWVAASFPGYWMASAGEQCSNATRNLPPGSLVGCPSWSQTSDGVVCRDSALYGAGMSGFGYLNDGPKPDVPWRDTTHVYVHTDSMAGWGTAAILCGNSGDPSVTPQLFDPPPGGTLFPYVKATINAH
jgi:hypothetical protein